MITCCITYHWSMHYRYISMLCIDMLFWCFPTERSSSPLPIFFSFPRTIRRSNPEAADAGPTAASFEQCSRQIYCFTFSMACLAIHSYCHVDFTSLSFVSDMLTTTRLMWVCVYLYMYVVFHFRSLFISGMLPVYWVSCRRCLAYDVQSQTIANGQTILNTEM